MNSHNITVRFENGYTVDTQYGTFKDGAVLYPYEKSIYGAGYLGEGLYKAYDGRKCTQQYTVWKNMILRCYVAKIQKKYPTYLGCTVCEDWLNFQNFAKWYDSNFYQVKDEKMNLDKDILFRGNKIYSSETCIFVPARINMLFVKSDKARGEYPIGVTFAKKENHFLSYCSSGVSKGRVYLGYYKTPDEAFSKYKDYKEFVIKSVAEDYKEFIPQKLYDSLIDYKVKITD